MRKIKITDLAGVIRSKNSGPFELTLDLVFKDRASFELARRSGIFTRELFAGLYNVKLEDVLGLVEFEQANAIKATLVRPIASGAPGDTDVYGAQQHAPLLDLEVPVEDSHP
ncbi:MAG: hypothetical protein BWY80_00643 [Firmicutes bacterium ADurb.Bin456]|nr:MAG: hypothetical protein BWY80_00643 [Firmicutes bacterium ADurb.Bin456]